jgi:7-cyano-7-deazaguanine synthase
MAPRAVVLLSGGLDSTTALAIARAEGYECHALSFEYGQRHARELESARRVAAALGATAHLTLRLDLRAIGGSALTADIPSPRRAPPRPSAPASRSPYVPARNTIFLSHALAWAEVNGAQDIFIGVNVLDASGYPDCRPEYIAAFEHLANLATRAGVEGRSRFRIHSPAHRAQQGRHHPPRPRPRRRLLPHLVLLCARTRRARLRPLRRLPARSKGFTEAHLPDPGRRRIKAHPLRWPPSAAGRRRIKAHLLRWRPSASRLNVERRTPRRLPSGAASQLDLSPPPAALGGLLAARRRLGRYRWSLSGRGLGPV